MNRNKSIDDIVLIHDEYNTVRDFIERFPKLTLSEFDHYTVSNLNLFAVREDIDNEEILKTLRKIEETLPAINRIFVKPIIQLIELDEIVPIEAVRTINNKAMQHIAVHSELWDNIKNNGIKPQKLMSRIYKDNYSIYENIVFAKTIDQVLIFLKKNISRYKNLIYASKVIEFNVLDRLNHLEYFLAIGKLHTGYIREYSKFTLEVEPIYLKMKTVYDKVSSKLKCNVYRKNKDYNGKFMLRQTNILHMQKDYHKVYNLYSYFLTNKLIINEMSEDDNQNFNQNYFDFCEILTIFSLMHFGFSCEKDVVIDLKNLNLTLTNRKWSVNISKSNVDSSGVLVLEFNKNKTYRIVIEPISIIKGKLSTDIVSKNETISKTNNLSFDEFHVLSPVEDVKDAEVLSIHDIDSFRLLQQYILRGMIYSDTEFDDCPFCNDKLVKEEDENGIRYVCKNCNTVIEKDICDISKKEYYYTYIKSYDINSIHNKDIDDSSVSFKMHYRNITDMTESGQVICPICHKVHKQK